MILLDTNVLSALMRSEPETVVVDWLDAQPSESIWTTSVTVFEIRTGLELLTPSRRRRHLEAAFDRVLNEDLDQRVLSFDVAAAVAAGEVVARNQRVGKAVEVRDAQIAGIALARKAPVATRNIRHFKDLGVRLVDPWSPAGGPKL
ncbi:MAG: type II toxin-antitoxin system VapC family toxin [Actinomycetota bacterium]|jgi:predicted nucleic acid-binding protein|nr:type II toxin-antitoxin system VapC family toxin [Actinomycetota bacterium]